MFVFPASSIVLDTWVGRYSTNICWPSERVRRANTKIELGVLGVYWHGEGSMPVKAKRWEKLNGTWKYFRLHFIFKTGIWVWNSNPGIWVWNSRAMSSLQRSPILDRNYQTHPSTCLVTDQGCLRRLLPWLESWGGFYRCPNWKLSACKFFPAGRSKQCPSTATTLYKRPLSLK